MKRLLLVLFSCAILSLPSFAFAVPCRGGRCAVTTTHCQSQPSQSQSRQAGRWPHRQSLPYAIGAVGRWVVGARQRHQR